MRNTVFVVQHSYETGDNIPYDETKFIGVYSTKAEAEKAVERLREQSGFKQSPEIFFIDEYALNQDHWCEGFVTVRAPIFFSVWRRDTDNNIFLVQENLSETEALELVISLGRNEKEQTFWAKEHA